MARRVTIVDVAREAGVAISTVSAALNGRDGVAATTRERVAEVANELGWVPSMRGRSLVSQRAWAVGLVIQRPSGVLEADPFFAGFLGGIESVLDVRGYALVLHTASTPSRTLERVRHLALGGIVDGVFLTDVQSRDARVDLVTELGLPAVSINARFPRMSSVSQDHRSGFRALLELLIARGHQRIAHVAGPEGFVHADDREQLWRAVLADAGLAPGPLVRGDFTSESGARAADELLALPQPPTAVVCANDLTAIGFISRAAALGVQLPEEISVTGFDGIQLSSYTTPPLTTVETSPHELGSEAASLLLAAIEGEPVRHAAISPARVVERGSVAAPVR